MATRDPEDIWEEEEKKPPRAIVAPARPERREERSVFDHGDEPTGEPTPASGIVLAYLAQEDKEPNDDVKHLMVKVLAHMIDGKSVEQACQPVGISKVEYLLVLAYNPTMSDQFERAIEMGLMVEVSRARGVLEALGRSRGTMNASTLKAELDGISKLMKMGRDMRTEREARSAAEAKARQPHALVSIATNKNSGIDPQKLADAKNAAASR